MDNQNGEDFMGEAIRLSQLAVNHGSNHSSRIDERGKNRPHQ